MAKKKLYDVVPFKGMRPEVAVMAAMLEDGTREWREEIGDVPEEAIIWQPFPGGHSIGGLLLHIADVEGWWIEEAAAGGKRTKIELAKLLSKETNQDDVQWPVPPRKPFKWYFDLQNRVRKRSLKTLATMKNPSKRYKSARSGNEFTVRWILTHVVQHESYHGGQAVLLKLMWERTRNGKLEIGNRK